MDAKSDSVFSKNSIDELLNTIRYYWYYFAVIISISALLSLGYIYWFTPINKISTTLLLREHDPLGEGNVLLKTLDLRTGKRQINTEIQKLKSRGLIEKTLSRLDFDVSYFRNGRIKDTEVYQTQPFYVEDQILNDRFYGIPFYLEIVDENTYKLEIETENYKYEETHLFSGQINTGDWSLKIIKNSSILNSFSIDQILEKPFYQFHFNRKSVLIKHYQENLGIASDKDIPILEVYIEDAIPERAIAFLNTLTSEYIHTDEINNNQVANNTVDFIEDQLSEILMAMENSDLVLEEFEKQKGVISLSKLEELSLNRLGQYQEQMEELQMELKSLDFLNDYINTYKDSIMLAPSVVIPDPLLLGFIQDLIEKHRERDEILIEVKENTQPIHELDQKISNIKASLVENIDNIRKTTLNKIDIYSDQIKEYEKLISRLPKKNRQLVSIQRGREINEKLLLYLMQKKAEINIVKASNRGDIVIVDAPFSLGIVRPNKPRIVLVFIAVGLIIASVLVYLKQLFTRPIFLRNELEDLTSLPIISVIGHSDIAEKTKLIVEADPESAIAESFRYIRMNCHYLCKGIKHKIILVTSAFANEGKTFCSMNLAVIFARGGNKIVLLSLDLHQPGIHQAFNLTNDIGMTTLLNNQAKLPDIIQRTNIKNLDVIVAGPVCANSHDLITNEMMKQTLTELREKYDYIILDTPPIGVLIDAQVLIKDVDITLFMIRASVSKKVSVDLLHEMQRRLGPENINLVFNDAKQRDSYYNDYKTYYAVPVDKN
ncbi:MAG: polysaccharide biosynthesis tyrosine autokinase [Flavobacteriales bacterium]|nr:polysaccharide biosynthesis tyrosine autokinase [Flavobacteriales bacterium]